MQFYNPKVFILFWLLPLVLLLFYFSRHLWKRRIRKLGVPETVRKLMPHYRAAEHRVRFVCTLLVFAFAIMALARPQWGEETKKIQRKGADVIFLLDASLSMLAEDAKPNRLEKAKREIKDIVKKLKGDRIGIVAFAGSSFLQSPLTLDYAAFFLFLDSVEVGTIPDPGTSLDRAMLLSIRSFPQEDLKHKALILFTDGEDHEGGIDQALEEIKKSKIRVYTIGLGSTHGEPIPLRDEQGRKSGFKKDRGGNVVMSKLNEPLLEKIATETGGLYFPSTPSEDEVDFVIKHLGSLGKRQFKEREVVEQEDHYQVFLLLAFLFLVIEMLVRRNIRKLRTPLSILLTFMIFSGFIGTSRGLNEKGNELYTQKKYQTAIEQYRKAQVSKPEDSTIRYNLGTALYQIDNYREAEKEFEKSIAKSGGEEDKMLKAQALYNYGNTQYRLGNFEKAIKAYQEALEINPGDKDAKYNLEFIQKTKDRFEKKDEQRKQENQQKQPQQQNQQQNQQNQQQNQQQQQQQQQQNQQDQQKNQQDQQQQNQQNKQDQKNQQKQDQQQQDQKDQQKQDQQQQDQKDQQNQQDQQQKSANDQQDQKDKQDQKDQKKKDQEQEQKDQQQKEQPQEQQDQQQQKEKQNQQEQQKNQQQQMDEQQQEEQDEQQNEEDRKRQQEQLDLQEQQEQEEKERQQKEKEKQQEAQNKAGDDQEKEQESKKDEGDQPLKGSGKPLQGQMSVENALRILDAMKDSEKEFQDLRRPPVDRNPRPVEKDW